MEYPTEELPEVSTEDTQLENQLMNLWNVQRRNYPKYRLKIPNWRTNLWTYGMSNGGITTAEKQMKNQLMNLWNVQRRNYPKYRLTIRKPNWRTSLMNCLTPILKMRNMQILPTQCNVLTINLLSSSIRKYWDTSTHQPQPATEPTQQNTQSMDPSKSPPLFTTLVTNVPQFWALRVARFPTYKISPLSSLVCELPPRLPFHIFAFHICFHIKLTFISRSLIHFSALISCFVRFRPALAVAVRSPHSFPFYWLPISARLTRPINNLSFLFLTI